MHHIADIEKTELEFADMEKETFIQIGKIY